MITEFQKRTGNMATSKEKILEIIEEVKKGICDDCLSRLSKVSPRQQVNTITRKLQEDGILRREKGICQECSKQKLINKTSSGDSYSIYAGSLLLDKADQSTVNIAEKLDSVRRKIIKAFDKIDLGCGKSEEKKEIEHFSEKLARLEKEERITRNIASVIRLVNTFRNLVIYDRYIPNPEECELLGKALLIVHNWCEKVKQI